MIDEAKTAAQAALDHLTGDLQTVRTGRANGAMVENIDVVYFEQHMPLKALANITTPDATSITITPWDANSTSAIEKALREAKNLDATPASDGRVIHLNIPPPTAERRQQLIKQIGEKAEASHISLRNARHEALKDAQEQLKAKQISEDQFDLIKKDLDELVRDFGQRVDEAAKNKQHEIEEI